MSGLMYGAGSSGSGRGGVDKVAESNLDSGAEDTFARYFQSMPPKPEGMVRLFDRADYYTAHGDDAILVATSVFKTLSILKYWGGGGSSSSSSSGSSTAGKKGLPSVNLSIAAAKAFLRDALTSKQMRIEIWKGGGKRSNAWKVERKASPGNLQDVEDLLFMSSDITSSPIVMALKLRLVDGVPHVGAAFADATNRVLGVSEFADNDLFSNVESLIIQLGVKECLLPDDAKDPDLQRLTRVIDSCGVMQTLRKKSEYSSGSVEQDLNRLLNERNAGATLPEFSKKIAMGSMSVLMSYLGLLHDETNFGQYAISTHDLSQFLRLDASAVRALSLFAEPGASRSLSVFGLLNKCKTSQGTRLLGQWLKQPLVNLHEINRRHDLVETFVSDPIARQTLQSEYLRLMPDLRRISKKFQKNIASLEDVVRVYQAVLRLGDLVGVISSAEAPSERHRTILQEAFSTPIEGLNNSLAMFVEMVEATLDLNELNNHHFVIKPDFDAKLRTIKDGLDEIRDQIDEQHALAGKDLKLDTEKKLHLENHSTYGYCLRVTRIEANAIKGKKGYRDIATIKGGVYFTTSALKELDEEFRSLSDQYSTTQSRLVQDVIGIASSYCTPLDQLNMKLAELDVIVAFAHVSANAPEPYCRPSLIEMGGERRGDLKVVAARHPVLEVQEDINFIANDVEMVHDQSEFLVITGPNMGGKSTFIRQVGILALMAQAGCFVPAGEGAQLPIFDCILARVGAGDSQVKGVSTFMQEMLELAQILKSATPDSLVLIDELGRGTSTYDGFGIAYAASEWIATKVRCKTLFASHFAEITSLAEQVPHVRNLHVRAHVSQRKGGGKQDRDITLLYQVKEGISDRSYGIHVAELAGFPESVIRLAKRKAEELEDYQDDDGEEDEGAEEQLSAIAKELPKEVIDAGMALVEDFLQTWAKRSAPHASSTTTVPTPAIRGGNDEDEDLGTEEAIGGGDDEAGRAASVELIQLRKVAEEYRQRIEDNPWAKRILATF